MPNNGFSIGKDNSVSVSTPAGALKPSLITNFKADPVIGETDVKGMDGVNRNVTFHNGWQGSFDVERQDSTLDDFWAQQEADYHAGVSTAPSSIRQTIKEANGTISQFRYTGVSFKLQDAGDWAGDKTVKQKLLFKAARRIKL